jgi:undecaprenyl-diphosphatase
MELLEALIVGVIQGITEWLPISSEGVISLVLINFFSKPFSEAVTFSLWLHTGTLLAATLYFKSDLIRLISSAGNYLNDIRGAPTEESRLISFLIVSTFFTGILGLPIFIFGIEKVEFSSNYATALIGVLLIITGLIQKFSRDFLGHRINATIGDGILAGSLQALAIFPGLSRSGLTISALLLRGFNAKTALRLSFLMSIPAVLMAEAALLILKKTVVDISMLVAMVASFTFGYFTIHTFMKVAEKINFSSFCIGLGFLTLASLML